MARDDYFFEDHNDFDWDPRAEDVLDNMERYQSFMNDEMSKWLLDVAYFNNEVSRSDRTVAREWIAEYWQDHWGYSFREQFDWTGWRTIISPT
jgi:hypothetical protein